MVLYGFLFGTFSFFLFPELFFFLFPVTLLLTTTLLYWRFWINFQAVEVSSSIYDTSASFYSHHTILPINSKIKRGFFNSVRGFLTNRKSWDYNILYSCLYFYTCSLCFYIFYKLYFLLCESIFWSCKIFVLFTRRILLHSMFSIKSFNAMSWAIVYLVARI